MEKLAKWKPLASMLVSTLNPILSAGRAELMVCQKINFQCGTFFLEKGDATPTREQSTGYSSAICQFQDSFHIPDLVVRNAERSQIHRISCKDLLP